MSAPAKTAPKLLCLCDSPTLETGFARVARNLLSRWDKADLFEDIWVWGIGYHGFPHSIDFLANRICPASTSVNQIWYDPQNYERFLHLLEKEDVGGTPGGFTHLWILQDTFLLYPIATILKKLCDNRGIKTLLYFPIDAPIEPEWANIIEAVDHPVAYCNYGLSEACKALEIEAEDKSVTKRRRRAKDRIKVIPHGVDTARFRPIPEEESANLRATIRRGSFKGQISETDFLMMAVSQHQKRKGIAQMLDVLAVLKKKFPEIPAKLYMHMPIMNEQEGTDLRVMATQLGIVNGRDVFYGDGFFQRGHAMATEDTLNGFYNAADLLLTTSYGEGWGLPITEAMAAGLPVAGPNHTSIGEILADDRGILFKTLGRDVLPGDNSRVRSRSDVEDAAMKIANAWLAQQQENKTGSVEQLSLKSYAARASDWVRGTYLNWDRIAEEWLELLVG